MKQALLVCLAALASCSSPQQAGCPAIEKLARRDAAADARTALAHGDRHLLMLGGFVGSVPGVPPTTAYPARTIEGTSDTTTEACRGQLTVARNYAAKYNQTIVGGH